MFTRISSFAPPVLPRGGGQGAACSATGTAQCCESTQSVSSRHLYSGVTCSPISVIGVGGTQCNNQVVCCDDNNFNGLIALGCTPINIGL
ncbi:hydrophobin-251 [Armillaria mellea]|nr:hydrophobin-251 [Armillaria mellea]